MLHFCLCRFPLSRPPTAELHDPRRLTSSEASDSRTHQSHLQTRMLHFIRYSEWSSKLQNAFERNSSFPFYVKSKEPRDRISIVSSALPETAASVAVAATVVGAAATFLVRRTKASEATEVPLKICEECGGSGICSECNGEGFVLKKLSDKSAERARMTAKNMATRYTAGLPKKWSYCTKCSSARSCSSCGGSGKLSY